MASTTTMLFDLGLRLALVIGLGATSILTMAELVGQTDLAPLRSLAALRWQHRIIVVDAQIPDAVARLQAERPAIDERDILWFVLDQGRVWTNYPGPVDTAFTDALAQSVSQADSPVLLIGKDGGLKARADQLDLPALFARIDTMPMRRREMEAAE